MRETVIGRWGAILTIVFALPLTVQADTTDTVDSRILESRYLSVPMGPESAQTDLLKSIVDSEVMYEININRHTLDPRGSCKGGRG